MEAAVKFENIKLGWKLEIAEQFIFFILFECCKNAEYRVISGPIYEKYLTLEPDDMGDSPVENSVDDLESEMTEDGEFLKIHLHERFYSVFCSLIYTRDFEVRFLSFIYSCDFTVCFAVSFTRAILKCVFADYDLAVASENAQKCRIGHQCVFGGQDKPISVRIFFQKRTLKSTAQMGLKGG
jgi:hypothetical protein